MALSGTSMMTLRMDMMDEYSNLTMKNCFLASEKCEAESRLTSETCISSSKAKLTMTDEGEFSSYSSDVALSGDSSYRSDNSMLHESERACSTFESVPRLQPVLPQRRILRRALQQQRSQESTTPWPLGVAFSPLSTPATRLCVEGKGDDKEHILIVKNTFIDSRPARDTAKRSSSEPPKLSTTLESSEDVLEVTQGSLLARCVQRAPNHAQEHQGNCKPAKATASHTVLQEVAISEAGPSPAVYGTSDHPMLTWSVGSAEHHTGGCSPCAWYWKSSGCQRGEACGYCHTCDERQIRVRKQEKIRFLKDMKKHQGLRPGLGAPSRQ